MTEQSSNVDYIPLLLQAGVAAAFVIFTLFVTHILMPRLNAKKKDENFEKWYENYKEDLIEMYTKTVSIIKNKDFTDTVIDYDSEKYFNIFIYNIYDASSKYILHN